MALLNFLIPSYVAKSWVYAHQSHVFPFTITQEKNYTYLFNQFISSYNESYACSSLSYIETSVYLKYKKSLKKRFQGSCFGICRALIDCHLKDCSLEIFKNGLPPLFLKQALYYTVFDIIRYKIEKKRKTAPDLLLSEEQEWMETLKIFNRYTFQLSACHFSSFKTLSDTLIFLDQQVILLHLWKSNSSFSFFRVSPHTLFIFQNSNEKKFYFYDTLIQAFVYSHSFDTFIDLFKDYIKKNYFFYLRQGTIWRFESYPLEQKKLS